MWKSRIRANFIDVIFFYQKYQISCPTKIQLAKILWFWNQKQSPNFGYVRKRVWIVCKHVILTEKLEKIVYFLISDTNHHNANYNSPYHNRENHDSTHNNGRNYHNPDNYYGNNNSEFLNSLLSFQFKLGTNWQKMRMPNKGTAAEL